MTHSPRRPAAALLAALLAGAPLRAQPTAPPAAPPAADTALAPFAGTYAYHGATTLELVPLAGRDGPRLVAVIDEAKYPLRPLGGDRFLNGVGDTIPFARDAAGRVTGFAERGTPFRRLADTVTRAAAASVVPRPPGPDGRPARYAYRPPPDLGDGLAAGDLAAAGLDRALAEQLVGRVLDGTYADVDAVLVYRRGRLVLEEYFHGYDAARPHQLRSATKSVVAALVGAAVDRGALAGEGERVLPRLPYGPLAAYAHPDPRKAALTLGDLLTMRSGLACDDWDAASPGNENRVYPSPDWVKFVLDLPQLRDPGAEARYCSGGVHVAGRVVERATGMPLPDFAQRALFAPLGVRPADYRWPYALDSTNARTFAQLSLRPRDLLKFGVLHLDGGRWQGRQVLPRAWVERSTARVTRINTRGYGYLWWHQTFAARTPGGPRRVDVLNASGHGGQKLYVLPAHDAVVVFTGSGYARAGDSAPNAAMADVVLPALLAAGPAGGR